MANASRTTRENCLLIGTWCLSSILIGTLALHSLQGNPRDIPWLAFYACNALCWLLIAFGIGCGILSGTFSYIQWSRLKQVRRLYSTLPREGMA